MHVLKFNLKKSILMFLLVVMFTTCPVFAVPPGDASWVNAAPTMVGAAAVRATATPNAPLVRYAAQCRQGEVG